MSIITVLGQIEKNPLIYLGGKDVRFLRAFIDGYLTCDKDNKKDDSSTIIENFKNYFWDIYDECSYFDVFSVLLNQYQSQNEAFDRFFELFNKFIGESKIGDSSVIDS